MNSKVLIGGALAAAAVVLAIVVTRSGEKPPPPEPTHSGPPDPELPIGEAPTSTTSTTARSGMATMAVPPGALTSTSVKEKAPGIPMGSGEGVHPNGKADINVFREECQELKGKKHCQKIAVPATLIVNDKYGKVAEIKKTMTHAAYRFDLPVGKYEVLVKDEKGRIAAPVPFELEAGKVTGVDITLDGSGK